MFYCQESRNPNTPGDGVENTRALDFEGNFIDDPDRLDTDHLTRRLAIAWHQPLLILLILARWRIIYSGNQFCNGFYTQLRKELARLCHDPLSSRRVIAKIVNESD